MNRLLRLLDFLNLTDDAGNLSITNISVILMVSKLVLTSNPDLATIGVTAVSFLNYMHKRSAISGSNEKS